ncbi:MAG TPA: phage major capsid protein [Pseudolabrys sp.]|nr:phage major capsid protein [Pseudolabrys sp.]
MSELNTKIDKLVETFKVVEGQYGTRLSELERHVARMPDNDNRAVSRSDDNPLAAALLDSKELQDLTSTFRGRAVVKLSGERAAITSGNSTVGAGRSAGTSLVLGHRVAGVVTPFERRLTIRDLVTVARTTSNSVEWVKEAGFTNNARPVTEGQTKPESDLNFNLLTAPVRVIAHTFKVSRQMLDDAPALAAYIGSRGTYGLKYVEEQQILTGNGVGQNLNGIVPQATSFVPPFSTTAEQAFDRINQALAQVGDANAIADGIVLNATDWRRLLGIKDGDERYLAQQAPFGVQPLQLWGLPVVPSQSMAPGEFLAGQFAGNCFIFDRLDTEVLISTEDGDNFVKNMATVRIESRLAFVVTRPEALITGDLTAST